MRRTLLISAAVAALVVPAFPAQAGGFCVDRDQFQDRATNRVVMKGDCFAPTVARVDPGDEVTFVNLDAHAHTVGGVALTFGDPHEEVSGGERVVFRFEEEGVFPYFCVLHPGMAGAVVVGDGTGSATAGTAAIPVEPASAPGERAAASADHGTPVAQIAIAAVVALTLGIVATTLLVRRRRALRPA